MPAATILVTGAGGFVGQHLLEALHAAFPAARVIASGLTGGDRLDVTDAAMVNDVFDALKPDFCIHLAAITAIGAANADPDMTWGVNCHGTLNIGRAILARSPTTRLMFVSSSEVYGASFKSGLALDETAALAPMNFYAASKAAAEMGLCALAAQGLAVQRLRPFNHTGPGQSEEFVVPAFAGQIARMEARLAPPRLLVGALETERDFLDIRDVCAAYIACIEKFDALENNMALNIATGQAVRIGDVLDRLLARAAVPITVAPDPARLRRSEIMRAAGDAGAARSLLGWRPRYHLDETIDSVLAAARDVLKRANSFVSDI